MKKLLALFLTVLVLAGCAPAVYDGPTESAWVVTENHFTFYDPDTGETWTRDRAHSYDSFGNLSRTLYYEDGKLTEENRFTYDSRGNCIREVTWNHFWIFSRPISRIDHTYDDRDRLLTDTYRNGLGLKTGEDAYTYDDEANTVHWVGTYDTQTSYLNENGDIIRTVGYSEPAGVQMETLYEYDDQGRNTKVISHYDGALSSTTEKRYDDQGRLLEYILHSADGEVLAHDTYRYDGNTVTILDMDGYKTVEILRPDGQTEKMETYYPSGALRSRSEYTYRQIQIPTERRETP